MTNPNDRWTLVDNRCHHVPEDETKGGNVCVHCGNAIETEAPAVADLEQFDSGYEQGAKNASDGEVSDHPCPHNAEVVCYCRDTDACLFRTQQPSVPGALEALAFVRETCEYAISQLDDEDALISAPELLKRLAALSPVPAGEHDNCGCLLSHVELPDGHGTPCVNFKSSFKTSSHMGFCDNETNWHGGYHGRFDLDEQPTPTTGEPTCCCSCYCEQVVTTKQVSMGGKCHQCDALQVEGHDAHSSVQPAEGNPS